MRAVQLRPIVIASALVLALSACKPSFPTYVDQGGRYTQKSALALISQVKDESLNDVSVSEAVAKRHQALTGLREQGGSAATAARLITRVFPADTAAVPYYVESASFEGTAAVLILEAIGRQGSKLTDKRLWVLSRSGDVLISGMR